MTIAYSYLLVNTDNSMDRDFMVFESVKVKLNIPLVGGIEGTWKFDENEKKAAWEMYVELITRIPVVELKKR